jgi:hypothetical protein
LLKFFLYAGHFPQHRHAVPLAVVEHLAAQLHLSASSYLQYDWQGRTIKTHRAQIREALGFREATVQDADDLTSWLCDQLLATHDPRPVVLRDLAYAHCRNLKLEPPRTHRHPVRVTCRSSWQARRRRTRRHLLPTRQKTGEQLFFDKYLS